MAPSLKLAMRSFWSDPYLWIHLAGLAAFPLFLEGCLVGFAIGDPLLPVSLELLLVAIAGIVPIAWMQWQRPFYIFSLVAITVKPEKLTDDQRRLLSLFKTPRNRVLEAIVPFVLFVTLQKVYELAPIAVPAIPFPSEWRLVGLFLAAVAFLGCNLFVQVPVSVASVMLTSEATFATTSPFPLQQIQQNFTLAGLRLNQILPPVTPDTQPTPAKPDSSAASETPPAAAPDAAIADTSAQDPWQDATQPTTTAETVDRPSPSTSDDPPSVDHPLPSEPDQPQ